MARRGKRDLISCGTPFSTQARAPGVQRFVDLTICGSLQRLVRGLCLAKPTPNLTSNQLFQPAFPDIGPCVRNDVCAKISAPRSECSVKDSERGRSEEH